MRFDAGGMIVGGAIIDYLLEKSRVVFQNEGERNYHVFYQLAAAVKEHADLKKATSLEDANQYHFMNQSSVISIDGMSDEKEFETVDRSMTTLGYNADDKNATWEIVAALLHLSNTVFGAQADASGEEGSKVDNPETIDVGAKMLGLEPAALTKCLTSRNIGSRSVILVSYKPSEASMTRDALAKAVYGALFKWTITKINKTLETGTAHKTIIGVLDIFGFESFENNSFEQLCINYCNEKLQFHFNEHIFRLEQEVYASEGVTVPRTDFEDNGPTLELLEKKNTGIFAMIDEEIHVPKGSDDGFLHKAISAYDKKHKSFVKPTSKNWRKDQQRCAFGIHHYAGEVFYNVEHFLEKNKDELHADVTAVLQGSENALIKELFPKAEASEEPKGRARGRGGSKKKSTTLGAQFKKQLSELMTTLNATEPHFVRCMKPNKKKVGGVYEAEMMLAQLRYSGLLEVCRIRKLGFPLRRDFDEFYKRYRCIAPGAGSVDALLSELEAKGTMPKGQWAKGKSKVFMRNSANQALEAAREDALVDVTIVCQKTARRFIFRSRFCVMKKTLDDIKAAIAARDEQLLENALNMCGELPHKGAHMPIVKEGQILMVRLTEEGKVVALLTGAIEARDKHALQSAVAAAGSMKPPFDPPAIAQAKSLITKIEEEEKVLKALKDATAKRDRDLLTKLLLEADHLDLHDKDEVRHATVLKERLDEEAAAVEALREAIKTKDANKLQGFLSRCQEMGINAPEIAEAKALMEKLAAEGAARTQLTEAVATRKLAPIISAIDKATKVGLSVSEKPFADATALKATLEGEIAASKGLEAALEAREIGAINAALERASSLGLEKYPEYEAVLANAKEMKSTLEKENACKTELKAAVSKGEDALAAALATASSLGLTGPEVDAAQAAIAKIHAKAGAAGALKGAATSNDVAAVEAAIAKGKAEGISGADMAAAEARLAQLKAKADGEKGLIASLVAATASNDLTGLSASLAQANKLGLATKYPAEIAAAKECVKRLMAQDEARSALAEAVKAGDVADIETAIGKMEASKCGPSEITQAKSDLANAKYQADIYVKIDAAIAASDDEGLLRLVEDAEAHGLKGPKITQAKVLSNRTKAIEDAKEKIAQGSAKSDLGLLNEGLEMAIQLGLNTPETATATELRDMLQENEAKFDELKAAMKTLKIKTESPSGIVASDIAPLEAVFASAKAQAVPPKAKEMVDAETAIKNAKAQLEVQAALDKALAMSPMTIEALREAVDVADDLELGLATQKKAKEELKKMGDKRQAEKQARAEAGEDDDEPVADVDEMKAKREAQLKQAEAPRFKLAAFDGLRKPEEYAKGTIMHKKAMKEGMLVWSGKQIPRSLTSLPTDKNKLAMGIFKALLGYMGDKQMQYPATLAQDVLKQGVEIPELRDEIYIQMMKQLTQNQVAASILKGWQLMCMCTSTFPPTTSFENFLLNFMITQSKKHGIVGNYAAYCMRTLQGMLEAGASGFLPSIEEIQAYNERPPILATIALVDGMILTEELPVTPDLNSGKVAEICAQFLELQDERVDTMGIFVMDLGKDPKSKSDPDAGKPYVDLPRTPKPLRSDDFLGDAMVQWSRKKRLFKYVFKRKIYLAAQNTPSEDPMFARLNYLQAESDTIMVGRLGFEDEDKVAELAATSIAVALSDGFPRDEASLAAMEDPTLLEFLPLSWRSKGEKYWASKILPYRAKLGVTAAEGDEEAIGGIIAHLQETFVTTVSEHEKYGSHFFVTHKLKYPDMASIVKDMPDDMTIAFNETGMYLLDSKEFLAKGAISGSHLHMFGWVSRSFARPHPTPFRL